MNCARPTGCLATQLQNLRNIENPDHRLEHRLWPSAPTEQDIANEMGLPLADYQQMLDDARGYQLIHYDDNGDDGDNDH